MTHKNWWYLEQRVAIETENGNKTVYNNEDRKYIHVRNVAEEYSFELSFGGTDWMSGSFISLLYGQCFPFFLPLLTWKK